MTSGGINDVEIETLITASSCMAIMQNLSLAVRVTIGRQLVTALVIWVTILSRRALILTPAMSSLSTAREL